MRNEFRLGWMAVLALGMGFAAGAIAQDREEPREYRDRPDAREAYRRGYDDGYERGLRRGREEGERRGAAVAPPPPPPAPVLGPIHVSSALYGDGGNRSCNAMRFVASRSNGRRSASFEVTNEMCGDPAKGGRKSLDVAYQCGDIAKTATAYEHRTIFLDCNS